MENDNDYIERVPPMSELKLPELNFQTPTCGNCEAEVGMDSPDLYYCVWCGLVWSGRQLTPGYDEEASEEPCGAEIETTHFTYQFMMSYHADTGAFRPCSLPKGHESIHYFIFEPAQ